MIRFDDLQLFVRTAALGSFSAAAREADLLPGQASAAIKRLERELDTRLFARSTRSLRLTAAGEQYLPHAREALAALHEGRERLLSDGGRLRGLLQIAAPSDLGRNLLLPWIGDFRRAHPQLQVRLRLSDHVTDVFRDPVDVAIRYGRIDDASFVALPLAPDNRRVLVAAPAYLRDRGRPTTVDELAAHDALLYQLGGRPYDRWAFTIGGQRHVVRMRGTLTSDDADVVRRWAVAGEGIAYKSWLDVQADVDAGRLELLLPGAIGESTPLSLICPHRRQFSPAVRLLHHLLREHCAALPAAPPSKRSGH
ncbi:LysR family transcriptional regulator [Solimonas marina]|uniref:LysR family transcriptional regulator n=1 Tax=Solimonas marina TaxID=2714601 RepID=A0A969W5T1_9GAMM|nr:LysR family transcriptional regulator [Solimonas marina]NKF20967.1 LysR family transcriptional regulator [Solimonas marina]